MLIIAGLAGVAFGWISLHKTRERVLISIEIGKVKPVFEQLKQAGGRLLGK